MTPAEIIERSYLRGEHLAPLETALRGRLEGPIITPAMALGGPALSLTAIFDALVQNLRARYGLAEEFRVCLLDEQCRARNACCFRLYDTYYVVLPYEIANHLMYQAELVLTCEPFAQEFAVDPALVQITPENFRSIPHADGEPVIEHPPGLLSLARALGEAAMMGLMLHELGHILHGHLGLLSTSAAIFSESAAEVPPRQDEWLTRQTLEFDADCFAAAQIIRIFSEGRVLPPTIGPLVPTQAASVKIAVTAMHLMHRSFDDGETWDPTVIGASRLHPPARLRMMLVREVGLRAIDRWLRVPPADAIWEFYAQPMVAVEQSFALLGRRVDWLKTAEAEEVDLRAYLGRLLGRWAKLRPDLLRLKLGSVDLAPAQTEPA